MGAGRAELVIGFPLRNLTFNRWSETNSNMLPYSSYSMALHLCGSLRHVIKASSLTTVWRPAGEQLPRRQGKCEAGQCANCARLSSDTKEAALLKAATQLYVQGSGAAHSHESSTSLSFSKSGPCPTPRSCQWPLCKVGTEVLPVATSGFVFCVVHFTSHPLSLRHLFSFY